MNTQKKSLVSGYTMLPIIWPHSILKVAPFRPLNAQVGDMVCLSTTLHTGAARRIVKIDKCAEQHQFHVKEDASDEVYPLASDAIIYTILGVSSRSLSFSTNGAVGKATTQLALSDTVPAKLTRKGLNIAARIAKHLTSESPF